MLFVEPYDTCSIDLVLVIPFARRGDFRKAFLARLKRDSSVKKKMFPWPKIPPENHKSPSDNFSSQLREVDGLQSRTKGEKESQAVKNLKLSMIL